MATGIIGSVSEFDEKVDSFQNYVDRIEQFFIANDILSDDKKRAVLLSSVGARTYKLLCTLVSPSKPAECQYGNIVQCLREHHNPRPSTIVQRFKFNTRTRAPSESVRTFVSELKKLSEFCEYGGKLNEMLRDRIVCGINDTKIQQRLLAEKSLTYEKTLEIAQAMEAAVEGARNLASTNQADEVNALQRKSFQRPKSSAKGSSQQCYRCGGDHTSHTCTFKERMCFKCRKTGHIAKVCRQSNASGKGRTNKHNAHAVGESETYNLFSVRSAVPPLVKHIQVNDQNLPFQVDTGASVSVMCDKVYKSHFKNVKLKKSHKNLRTYSGEKLKVLGELEVTVTEADKTFQMPLVVVKGNGPSLLGRDWLQQLTMDWSVLNTVNSNNDNSKLGSLLERHASVFQPSAGCLQGVKIKLHTRADATPKFCKSRQPPYALRERIEEELARLQREGIVEPVEFSDWATPIVPVVKSDGSSVRICGDFKAVNLALMVDKYPVPRIEDLAYALSGGEKFTKIDFSHAYTQLELDDDSKALTTINTHKGLFRYNRLCFGISSAPGIFQRTMESIFRDVPCVNYLDDVYITGRDDQEHLANLEKVLSICKKKGLSLRKEKCEFLRQEVSFLGYRLDKTGIHPMKDKVAAIQNAPRPKNVQEVKSFLGLINYYGKFIPNLAQLLAPLHALLRKNTQWRWSKEHDKAFQAAKDALISEKVLVHFDPRRECRLVCDASPYGVGAVLSHPDSDGVERPVAYASRSLKDAEKKYSQIDREGLAVIFAVKKFHKFIANREVQIYTDHRPLLGLLGADKPIPEHASARVQRWALTLSAYSYKLFYRPGRDNSADALSRLPLPESEDFEVPMPGEVSELLNFLDRTSVSVKDIATATEKDPVLRRVLLFVKQGWPEKTDEQIRHYAARKNELSVESNCVLWGTRVVVPASLQHRVLDLLHDDSHVGMARMKAQARSWVWWPHIDADIEKCVKICYTCAKHNNKPAKAPLFPWEWPEEPWKRVHLDFAGPFMGKMFLIVVDAHSKWLEVKIMNKITALDTILELRDIFSSLGLPETIVTDNGPTFTSAQFRTFMSCNGVKHVTVSPYHPSSNGLAERSVQTFKKAMTKISSGSVREKLCKFLTKYRSTPHTTTGLAPAELMFGRNIRTHLDLLHPCLHDKVTKQVDSQKANHDRNAQDRDISVHDNVFVRNFSGYGDKWIPGMVVEATGPLSFKVKTASHGIVRRHQDQIRISSAHDDFVGREIVVNDDFDCVARPIDGGRRQVEDQIDQPTDGEVSNSVPRQTESQIDRQVDRPVDNPIDRPVDSPVDRPVELESSADSNHASRTSAQTPTRRTRSGRVVKAPERLSL